MEDSASQNAIQSAVQKMSLSDLHKNGIYICKQKKKNKNTHNFFVTLSIMQSH